MTVISSNDYSSQIVSGEFTKKMLQMLIVNDYVKVYITFSNTYILLVVRETILLKKRKTVNGRHP